MTDLNPHALDLSIIIVTHNSRNYLRDCLESVQRAAAGIEHEIIVVDNASDDGTPDIVSRDFSRVRLNASKDNRGLSRGNNKGIAQSRGRYLLLLNPDTIVSPGALTTLLEEVQRSPGTGVLGCRLLNADRSLQQSFGFEVSLFNEAVRKFFFNLWEYYRFPPAGWVLSALHSKPREVSWIKGACMLVCRQAMFDAELMDESFFMYLEDADLCRRIRQLGWKVRYTPEAEILHFGEGSTRSNPWQSALEFRRSQLHYFKKHLGPTHLKILKIYMGIKIRKNLLQTTIRKWIGWGSPEQLAQQERLLKKVLILIPKF